MVWVKSVYVKASSVRLLEGFLSYMVGGNQIVVWMDRLDKNYV